jgi:hypothetical protein
MKYEEARKVLQKAWGAFFDSIKEAGIDHYAVDDAIDCKDGFNLVDDAFMEVALSRSED